MVNLISEDLRSSILTGSIMGSPLCTADQTIMYEYRLMLVSK
jgi:hypothetical protein